MTKGGRNEGVTLAELAKTAAARLLGDGAVRIRAVRLPDEAGPHDLAFAPHPRFARRLDKTKAAALLTSLDVAADRADELPCAVLASENPPLSLVKVLELLHPQASAPLTIDDRAAVHVEAKLGAGVSVGPFAYVGRARLADGVRVLPLAFVDDNVEIGAGSVIGPGAVLLHGVRVGAHVVVHPGAVLGGDGFRYAADGPSNIRVPQVAGVVVGDRVEIGANACVDRGDLRDTRVGAGTKIDNLAQIGHGVQIGRDVVLVAQAGIGGDTVIGDRAVFGGQVGVVPYADIGHDARIGAKSGVTRDIEPEQAVTGIPAYPHHAWLKTSIRLPHVDGLFRRLQAAEKTIAALSERLAALEGTNSPEEE